MIYKSTLTEFFVISTMFKFIIVICFILCCHGIGVDSYTVTSNTDDYYWRDFTVGQIPVDAIPGGYDKHKKPTYIGVVVQPEGSGLLPANIYPDLYAMSHAGMINSREGVHIHTDNVKILCSANKNRFRWIQTNSDGIFSVEGKPVKGGKEWNWNLYIGRAFHANERRIGRVFPPHTTYEGLWVPVRYEKDEAGEVEHFKDFEILVYK